MSSELQESRSGSEPSLWREKLDVWCERGILGAVLAVLVWGPLAFGAVRVAPGSVAAPHLYGFLGIQGLTALAMVLWAVRFYTQRPFRLLWPPICWGVMAFVVYAIVRCQFVDLEYVGRRELMSVVFYAVLFFVVLNNLTRRESATIVAMVLIVVGLGESLFAFYQFSSHYDKIWQVTKSAGTVMRGSGTYENPNHFAGFAEMIVPLALAYTVMGRLPATVKVLVGYSGLVMMVGVFVSESRGGNVAMAATLAVFCLLLLFQRDYRRRGILALVMVGLAGMAFFQQFGKVQERMEAVGGLGGHGDGRVFYWDVAERVFHQHLMWGAGPGLYRYLYPLYAPIWGQASPQNAANDYLNTLCEWGLAGFAIIMVTLGLLFGGVWRVWPYVKRKGNELGRRNSSKAAFVLGASLSLLAILIHSVVDFNMRIPANAVLAITLMALLSAHWRYGTEGFWVNPGNAGKALLAVTALGAAGYLVAEGVRAGQEFYWIQRGLDEKAPWDQEVAALKKAHEIEPRNYLTMYELGERYRLRAWEGDPGNEALAKEAMKWFEGAMMANPLDSWSPLRYGMCLDWLDRPNEASKYFVKALELRPNNAVIYFYMGWHCMDLENYPLAERWFLTSLQMHPPSDQAPAYWETVKERMAAGAKPAPGR